MTVCSVTLTQNPLYGGLYGMKASPASDKFSSFFHKLDLAWVCSFVNAYTVMLFFFMIFKILHVVFSTNSGKNWLTITNFCMVILQQVIGVCVLTSMVSQPYVYDLNDHKITMFSVVTIAIQKCLYFVILLTQVFEWFMLIMFLKFQKKNKLEELVSKQRVYNRIEKWCLAGFIGIQLLFFGIFNIQEYYLSLVAEQQKKVRSRGYHGFMIMDPAEKTEMTNDC